MLDFEPHLAIASMQDAEPQPTAFVLVDIGVRCQVNDKASSLSVKPNDAISFGSGSRSTHQTVVQSFSRILQIAINMRDSLAVSEIADWT